MHIPKWLIVTAALLFVMLIAAVAFFIGRDSSRPPQAEIIATAVPQEPPAANDPAPEEATPTLAEARSATAPVVTPSVSDDTAPPAAADARARVAAYFTQMDVIQSGGAGDAEEFATTIVNAALSGNFSGIDDVVRGAGDAEHRALALQPPGECADYHRMAITLLQESKAMVTTLRDALKRNDANALTSVGASAEAMKTRAENLAATEKAIRARFGL